MKSITLNPVIESPEDYDEIEAAIIKLFRQEIYIPLMKELNQKPETLQNSRDDLLKAISSGRIRFYRGHFRGTFNSTLSRELRNFGAEWDRKQGSWKIPQSKLPQEFRSAIALAEAKMVQTTKKVDSLLQQILPEEIAVKLKIEKLFSKTLWKSEKSFQESIRGITVAPKFTPEMNERISKNYSNNMDLWIQTFVEKEIKTLRQRIQENTTSGNRYESMISEIQKSYGVSVNKAKFLARQETSIFMAEFAESRFRDVGSKKYEWQCVVGSPNHPVRPMHKILDRTIHSWDNPPVVDKNGNRKHPGHDYNCRCRARPIITFYDDKKR